MCNLYNISTTQDMIIQVARAMRGNIGNLEPTIDVYPDRPAPIVRNDGGQRELARVRWGLPSSRQALFQAATKRADKLRAKGQAVDFDQLLKMEPDRGTTNVRRTDSKHWTRWLGVENRCVVPFSRFAEPDPARRPDGGTIPNAWFAADESEPLRWFEGIWVPAWESVRTIKEGRTTLDLFAFLTTEPNGIVRPIHEKAMPVILRNSDEIEMWLTAEWSEARSLQRPLPDEDLMVIERAPPATPDQAALF